MGNLFTRFARRMRLCALGLVFATIGIGVIAPPDGAAAQDRNGFDDTPLVVRNDRGGLLQDRLREIGQLRQQRRPVEIRGSVCFSTCTMYLGLPGTCVSPTTTFGFHGPSSYGRALDPATFNRASEVIASYYPAPLQRWYMDTGRFKIRSLYRIKGRDIIRMGVRQC
ncbi:MAG: hypothetical protein AAFP16_08985 [Pseudomonadota bacterium]